MRRASWISLFALALISLPGLARAQSAEQMADVRCVIVGVRMIQAVSSPALRTAGTMVALYYVGRLDGRNPSFDLESAIIKQLAVMTQADFAAAARRCGGSLQKRGRQLAKFGKDLTKRGHEMEQKSRAHAS